MGQTHIAHFGATRTKMIERTITMCTNARIERVREILNRSTNHHAVQRRRTEVAQRRHRHVSRRGIMRIVTGNHLKHAGGVIDTGAKHTDLFKR